MIPHRTIRISIALLPLLFAAAPARAQIWRGQSGGFDVAWTTRDVTARRAGGGPTVFSLRQRLADEWRQMQTQVDEDTSTIPSELGGRYRVLSVVGKVMSVEELWMCDCRGAHPISSMGFAAYDLSRSTPLKPRRVPITELVPEAAVVQALLGDRLIRMALDSAHVRTRPRTMAALLHAIGSVAIPVPQKGQTEEYACTYGVGDLASSWAIHHVENGRMAIRFSLSHFVEICRGTMVQIGITVPVPPALAATLAAADSRRAGFLMKDVRAIAGDQEAAVEFER